MNDIQFLAADQIKKKQKAIDRFIILLGGESWGADEILAVYTVLGDASDYDDYVADLVTQLEAKKTALQADYAAL